MKTGEMTKRHILQGCKKYHPRTDYSTYIRLHFVASYSPGLASVLLSPLGELVSFRAVREFKFDGDSGAGSWNIAAS